MMGTGMRGEPRERTQDAAWKTGETQREGEKT